MRGAQLLAAAAGERDVLCFDMGGTSCDVCLIAGGEVAETADGVVAGRPLALATLDIHTVGAGGGSIAWRDPGGALRVGPRSAGADPGPACYGRGGKRPTVTDANLLLGRLLADAPLAGGLELDREAARRAVGRLAAELGLDVLRCAEGIVRVAEAEMLRALRMMTVQRGIDPRGFALMAFGGAGPLHAAALARELGIDRILCPRASGVLCALGLAAAAPRRDAARTVMLAGDDLSPQRLAAERDALVRGACAALGAEETGGHAVLPTPHGDDLAPHRDRGRVALVDERPARVRVRYELRYRGQSFELTVEEDDCATCDPAIPPAPRDRADPALTPRPVNRWPHRATHRRCARPSRAPTSGATATATTAPRSSWSRSAPRAWGAAPTPALPAPPGAPGPRDPPHRAAHAPPGTVPAASWRPSACAASCRPARGSGAPRSARCPSPRCSCPPGGRARSTRTAPCAYAIHRSQNECTSPPAARPGQEALLRPHAPTRGRRPRAHSPRAPHHPRGRSPRNTKMLA